MAGDELELYQALLSEVNQRTNRQSIQDSIYQPIIMLLLGAEAYVASNSQFDNWTPVIVCGGICLFALLFMAQWSLAAGATKAHLSEQYRLLMELEGLPDFPIKISVYKREQDTQRKTRLTMGGLRILLAIGLIAIPTLLGLVTFLNGLPQFHGMFHPLFPVGAPSTK